MWKEDDLAEANNGFFIFPALPGEEKNLVDILKLFLTHAVHTPLRTQGISHSKEC